jgi:hypothetical protein
LAIPKAVNAVSLARLPLPALVSSTTAEFRCLNCSIALLPCYYIERDDLLWLGASAEVKTEAGTPMTAADLLQISLREKNE